MRKKETTAYSDTQSIRHFVIFCSTRPTTRYKN